MADVNLFDIFEAPPEDLTTAVKELFESRSEPNVLGSAGVQTTTGVIMLQSRDLDAWIVPSEAVLQVQFVISNTTGAALNDRFLPTNGCTLINGGFHLFQDIEILLGNKLIERIDNPGTVQLLKSYAMAENSFDETTSAAQWFYPEIAYRCDRNTATAAAGPPNYSKSFGTANPYNPDAMLALGGGADELYGRQLRSNASFHKRFRRSRALAVGVQQVVELWLPLSTVSGFCDHVKHAIRGVSMEVRLNRNTNFGEIIHGPSTLLDTMAAGAAYPVAGAANINPVIYQCSLWMPRVKPTLSIASALEQQLAADAATKYMFDAHTVYRSEEYQLSTKQVRWKVVSEAHKPVLALVGFKRQAQYNDRVDAVNKLFTAPGAADEERYTLTDLTGRNTVSNGGIFSRLNDITGIEVRVNNAIVPRETYRISFTDESCQRAFYDFQKAFAKDDFVNSTVMNFDTWRESPIFAFDLSKIDEKSVYQNIKTNDIEIRATMIADSGAGAQQAGAFTIYCMLLTEVEMSIMARDGRLIISP